MLETKQFTNVQIISYGMKSNNILLENFKQTIGPISTRRNHLQFHHEIVMKLFCHKTMFNMIIENIIKYKVITFKNVKNQTENNN